MTVSKNQNDKVAVEFISTLDSTTKLVQRLLEDIREGEVNFATLKTELSSLMTKVKELSVLVRDSEGEVSELTIRIALLERAVEELEEWVKHQRDKDKNSIVADKQGKWQVITAAITGGLALLASILALLMNLLGK